MEERKRSFEPPRKCLNLNAASELGIPWVPGGVQIPQLRLGAAVRLMGRCFGGTVRELSQR